MELLVEVIIFVTKTILTNIQGSLALIPNDVEKKERTREKIVNSNQENKQGIDMEDKKTRETKLLLFTFIQPLNED